MRLCRHGKAKKSPLIWGTQLKVSLVSFFSEHPAFRRTLHPQKEPQSPLASATADKTQHICKKTPHKDTHRQFEKHCKKMPLVTASHRVVFICGRRKRKIQPQQSTVNFSNHENILFFVHINPLHFGIKEQMVLPDNTPFSNSTPWKTYPVHWRQHAHTNKKCSLTCEPLKQVPSLSVPLQS